jgi:hypothetical protein
MATDLIQLIDKAAKDNLRHSIPDAQRKKLLEACETLRASLESPMETTFRICFAVSTKFLTLFSPLRDIMN